MSDDELYRRGIATAVACWARFARSVRGATVRRLENVDIAVFPGGPEKAIYNNAVLGRDIAAAEHVRAMRALESAYAAAEVASYAVWVHEEDDDVRETLERRGYRIITSTRAMGMQREEFHDAPRAIERAPADWLEHKRIIGVDDALLRFLDLSDFDVLIAADNGERVATGLRSAMTATAGSST